MDRIQVRGRGLTAPVVEARLTDQYGIHVHVDDRDHPEWWCDITMPLPLLLIWRETAVEARRTRRVISAGGLIDNAATTVLAGILGGPGGHVWVPPLVAAPAAATHQDLWRRIWDALAAAGLCDEWHSAECVRVSNQWEADGRPHGIAEYIMRSANEPAGGAA